MKDIKKIRKELQEGTVQFTCGLLDLFGEKEQVFITNHCDDLTSIKEAGIMGGSMNVNKFGPTCITLYSYDMLKNRTTGKIKYEDINIIK